jgi:hypothetical protein
MAGRLLSRLFRWTIRQNHVVFCVERVLLHKCYPFIRLTEAKGIPVYSSIEFIVPSWGEHVRSGLAVAIYAFLRLMKNMVMYTFRPCTESVTRTWMHWWQQPTLNVSVKTFRCEKIDSGLRVRAKRVFLFVMDVVLFAADTQPVLQAYDTAILLSSTPAEDPMRLTDLKCVMETDTDTLSGQKLW